MERRTTSARSETSTPAKPRPHLGFAEHALSVRHDWPSCNRSSAELAQGAPTWPRYCQATSVPAPRSAVGGFAGMLNARLRERRWRDVSTGRVQET